MAEKIIKGLPWFAVTALMIVTMVAVLNFDNLNLITVNADTATTSVTVGNSAPSLDVAYEEIESSTGSPTNAGGTITFKVGGDDPNGDDIFILVCKLAGYATTSDGTCPTCTGGTRATTSATDNATGTATYVTSDGDAEQNDWIAYVCDDAGSGAQACSSGSTGTGATAGQYSPFVVNHKPDFTAQANSGPVEPNSTITFFASSTDSDSYGGADTIKFVVCKTSGLTGTECDGGASDTWCSTTAASDPNCSATSPRPAVGNQAYYPYIFDNHGFATTDGLQGGLQNYVVSNVAPVVSSVTLNGGSTIDLSIGGEGPTGSTTVVVTANVRDYNGCADVLSVYTNAYPIGEGAGGCTAQNDNNCYYNVSCDLGVCDGDGYSASTTCSIQFWYLADPTDANTPRAGETWKNTVYASDGTATGTSEVSTGVELQSYSSLNVSETIQYGTLSPGQIADGTNLPQTATTTNTGNTGLDLNLEGTSMCDNFPTCGGNNIATTSQKYATSSVAYSAATALTDSPVPVELNCSKSTTVASPATEQNWWGLQVPLGTPSGSYTGEVYYTAVKSQSINW